MEKTDEILNQCIGCVDAWAKGGISNEVSVVMVLLLLLIFVNCSQYL